MSIGQIVFAVFWGGLLVCSLIGAAISTTRPLLRGASRFDPFTVVNLETRGTKAFLWSITGALAWLAVIVVVGLVGSLVQSFDALGTQ